MPYAKQHLHLATPARGPQLCTPKKGSREELHSGAILGDVNFALTAEGLAFSTYYNWAFPACGPKPCPWGTDNHRARPTPTPQGPANQATHLSLGKYEATHKAGPRSP